MIARPRPCHRSRCVTRARPSMTIPTTGGFMRNRMRVPPAGLSWLWPRLAKRVQSILLACRRSGSFSGKAASLP